jgi:8-oxo-dGTP pyrophosphatase MutT (NUDIX family)
MHEKNHPGQIALPGGAMEENETLEKTALREAFEEVGIVPDNVEIIGKMTPLPVPVSKYVITPFIGVTENEPKWNINEQEVDELIILKFKDLIDSNNGYYEDWDLNGNILRVPIFKIMNKDIWGATAAVLSELIDLSA